MGAASVRIALPRSVDHGLVTGASDMLFRAIEERGGVSLVLRGDAVIVSGPVSSVEAASQVLSSVIELVRLGKRPTTDDVSLSFDRLNAGSASAAPHEVFMTHRGQAIRAKTAGQQRYLDSIDTHTMTFCLGPAGTGKTYLAMAVAVAALKRREVGRIVLTRPVVEAGENLGFLPGTLEEKVDPYVRPLLDALYDLVDREHANEYVERGMIEIAPLAYMRGRTLNDAFVILDEAQNTTPEQMKMFLTRLGFNSKFIVNGDASQRDLPGRKGGFSDIEHILADIPDIAFIHLTGSDVVRHSLVGKIVDAYETFEAMAHRTPVSARKDG